MAQEKALKAAEALASEEVARPTVAAVALTNEEKSFAHHVYSAEVVRLQQKARLERDIAVLRGEFDPAAAQQLENQNRSLEDGAWTVEYERLWNEAAALNTPVLSLDGSQTVMLIPADAAANAPDAKQLVERVTGQKQEDVDTYPVRNEAAAERAQEQAEKADREARANKDK